jgi:hypothetical protein
MMPRNHEEYAVLDFCHKEVSFDQEWLWGFFATFGRSE